MNLDQLIARVRRSTARDITLDEKTQYQLAVSREAAADRRISALLYHTGRGSMLMHLGSQRQFDYADLKRWDDECRSLLDAVTLNQDETLRREVSVALEPVRTLLAHAEQLRRVVEGDVEYANSLPQSDQQRILPFRLLYLLDNYPDEKELVAIMDRLEALAGTDPRRLLDTASWCITVASWLSEPSDLDLILGLEHLDDVFWDVPSIRVTPDGPLLRSNLAMNATASASHTSPYDKLSAVNDGFCEFKGALGTRWTSYQSPNETDWLALEFDQETTFNRIELAIYDEEPGKGVQTPKSYVIEIWNGERWVEVPYQKRFPTIPLGGTWNEVRFPEQKARKVRVVFTRDASGRSGLTEIAVWNDGIMTPNSRGAWSVLARLKGGDAAGALASAKELAALKVVCSEGPLGQRLLPLTRAHFPETDWESDSVLSSFWRELSQAIRTQFPAPPRTDDGIELWWIDKRQNPVGKVLMTSDPVSLEWPADLNLQWPQWIEGGKTLAGLGKTGWWEISGGRGQQIRPFDASQFSISLDGSRYAISRPIPNRVPDIIVGSRTSEEDINLGLGYDPALSADGKNLTYLAWTGKWRLALWDGKESRYYDVPLHPTLTGFPIPSPDGRAIAFAMLCDDDTRQIGAVSLDGKHVRQITHSGRLNTLPAFSGDGRYLAYLQTRDGNLHDLRVVDLETDDESTIAEDVAFDRPAWRSTRKEKD